MTRAKGPDEPRKNSLFGPIGKRKRSVRPEIMNPSVRLDRVIGVPVDGIREGRSKSE